MHHRILIALLGFALSQACAAQHRVILDTDPSSDPDDVGCMAMLHTMASRGECEILAVINSIDHKEASLSISAINEFYGRGAIPVGDYKGYRTHHDAPKDLYSHMLANEYAHPLRTHSDAIDSVELYREILASADDESITIIVIGTMHNLFALLKSDACQYSSLSGKELVDQKVRLVATMGGNFIDGSGYDRTNWGGSSELCGYTEWSCLNTERNQMCRYVIENCPAPFVASGWEVGCGNYHDANRGNVMTGQTLKSLPTDHIARRSYEFHFATRGGSERIDRHSNDQCALHYAIRGEGKNYQAFLDGDIDLTESGECRWSPMPNRQQGYIQKRRDPESIAKEIEELMLGEVTQTNSIPSDPFELRRVRPNGKHLRLAWKPARDEGPSSWVVGYRVYRNDELVGIVYGTQFIDEYSPQNSTDPVTYRVTSLNAGGKESPGIELPIQPIRN